MVVFLNLPALRMRAQEKSVDRRGRGNKVRVMRWER